ncbi:MAG: replication-associated recombination protein A [Christensenellaceae bacterium]|nr:replication-associated recombination protein A [Christensenellaceae bacterium]
MDLFDSLNRDSKSVPLAERMRPNNLADFIGQTHLISKGSLLSRAIDADRLGSCIFWGPPGTGKTTLSHVIAVQTKGHYEKLNAVSSGVANAKEIIEAAEHRLKTQGIKTYLFLDECHRWSKAQSDCILSAMEKGDIVFIGSTTENPYVSMTRAIISRVRVFEFKPLAAEEIVKGLKRAVQIDADLKDYNPVVTDDAYAHFARAARGDVRTALNSLELAIITSPPSPDGKTHITKKEAAEATGTNALCVNADIYYDVISAYCKSLRGSDANAAIYYAMRLIESGCDPLLLFRRLIVHSAEDVGVADANALVVATSALTAFEHIGLPEGLIPLTEAIIYVCNAPKSNSVVIALDAAKETAKTPDDEGIPNYLRDQTYRVEKDKNYKYPHDFGGYVKQQYLPDKYKDSQFYIPLGYGEDKGRRQLPDSEGKK